MRQLVHAAVTRTHNIRKRPGEPAPAEQRGAAVVMDREVVDPMGHGLLDRSGNGLMVLTESGPSLNKQTKNALRTATRRTVKSLSRVSDVGRRGLWGGSGARFRPYGLVIGHMLPTLPGMQVQVDGLSRVTLISTTRHDGLHAITCSWKVPHRLRSRPTKSEVPESSTSGGERADIPCKRAGYAG